jgi:hypothetical protein
MIDKIVKISANTINMSTGFIILYKTVYNKATSLPFIYNGKMKKVIYFWIFFNVYGEIPFGNIKTGKLVNRYE